MIMKRLVKLCIMAAVAAILVMLVCTPIFCAEEVAQADKIYNWFADNWKFIVLGMWVVEKGVHITPTKYDDILWDMICKPVIGGIKTKLNK